MAIDLRTDEILDAIRSKLGTTITVGSNTSNINSKPEGHPFWWVEKAKYPAVFLHYRETKFEHQPKQTRMTYLVDVYYAMESSDAIGSGVPNPFSLCRQRAEVLLSRLEADKTLGLSYIQDSYPLSFSLDNELQGLYLEKNQLKTACCFTCAIEIAADRS